MPSDFGDESGEKFCDWLMKIGQDAGQDAMHAAARKLSIALKKTKGDTAPEYVEKVEWARLNMVELETIEGYDSIKQILQKALTKADIDHSFMTDKQTGHESLLFRVEDAGKVDRVFDELIGDVETSLRRADAELSKGDEPDKAKAKETSRDDEPLDARATRVRESAKALEGSHDRSRERASEREDKFAEVRAK